MKIQIKRWLNGKDIVIAGEVNNEAILHLVQLGLLNELYRCPNRSESGQLDAIAKYGTFHILP